MMHDSRSQAGPARYLIRSRLALVNDLHRVHLAIVAGPDEVHFLQFDAGDVSRMRERTIPIFVRDIHANSVVMSSPSHDRVGASIDVAILARTIETFVVPIVRIINADDLIGDFRATRTIDTNPYAPIVEALVKNWVERNGD